MTKSIKNSYEKLFMMRGSEALKEAVAYLIESKKAKTYGEIAKKTKISSSTMSAYISGNKPISKRFIERFNTTFDIDLINPNTYSKQVFFNEILSFDLPPIQPKTFVAVFESLRKLIRSQQVLIEGIRKTNDSYYKLMAEMYDVLVRHEKVIIQDILKKSKTN